MSEIRSTTWTWAAAAVFAVSCLSTSPASIATPQQAWVLDAIGSVAQPRCIVRVLAELGWQIERTADAGFAVHPGTPCARENLHDAHANGDLRLVLDPALLNANAHTRDALHTSLRTLLAHPATLCAFAIRHGQAMRRATTRLSANRGYRFSALQVGWIGFGWGGARAGGWRSIRSFGRGYMPADGNWRAIEGFYTGRVRSECGVGRQVAQYAAQAELYGPAGFDRAFSADEIVIGTFRQLRTTSSILLGSNAGLFVRDGAARHAAAMGRQGLVGLPGFIVHSFDASHLDDIHNQAQNFVVHDISPAAAAALTRNDGFGHYNAVNQRIWAFARGIDAPGRRSFERLVINREPRARDQLLPAEQTRLTAIEALLDDPFYREMLVYVHPMGVRSVGYHIVRLLDRNPRTPFQIELALHNVHTTLFARYLRHRLAQCAALESLEAIETSPRIVDGQAPVHLAERQAQQHLHAN